MFLRQREQRLGGEERGHGRQGRSRVVTPGHSTGGTERHREGRQRLAGKKGVVMTGETREKKGIVRGKERGREVEERY